MQRRLTLTRLAKMILRQQGFEIPFVTTLHGTDITLVGKDPSFEPVITFSINKSDIVTAVSENLKSETNQLFNIQKNIQVVPNFINIKEYQMNQNQYLTKYPNMMFLLVLSKSFYQKN